MNPLINTICNIFEKYILHLPEMDEETFDKFIIRIEKFSKAISPVAKAVAKGVAEGGVKELRNKYDI